MNRMIGGGSMQRGPLCRLGRTGLTAGAALLAAGAVGLAQAQNAPAPQSSSSAGAAVADAPPPVAPAPSVGISSSSITVTPVGSQSLAELDLFSAGRETGFGTDLWKGSSADVARMVIPSLRNANLSPAAAALGRDLLATASIAPDGAGNDAPLAAARASAVLALGDAEGASDILAHTPGVTGSSALSEVAAEAALITGRDDKACAIGDALSTDRDGVYWLRLRAFCQALAGKPDLAQLTFTLANQEAHDPDYARLMGAYLAGGGDAGPASLRDGLDFALSVQLKLDLGPALPTASRAIAQQLAAAPPAPPPPLAGASPTGASAAPPPPPPPPTEADVLAGTRAAASFTDYAAAAKAAKPGIGQLVELKTPLSTPVAVATAAVVASDLADADAIRAGLTVDGPGALDVAILDATLAAARGRADAGLIDRLIRLSETSDSHERGRAEAAAAMVAALGSSASPADRARMANFTLAAGQSPAGRTLAMDAAAETGLKGETALLALWVAAADGETGPSLEDRIRIERALMRVGLTANAQAFAVEGLAQLQAR
jgi:hypothetical protein